MHRLIIAARIVSILLLTSVASLAGPRTATVGGDCFLADATDHSGTSVIFQSASPSAVTDSTLTGTAGDFLQEAQA